MAISGTITLSTVSTNMSTFDLYSCTSSSNSSCGGTAFETNVTRTELLNGFVSNVIPDGTQYIKINPNVGDCLNLYLITQLNGAPAITQTPTQTPTPTQTQTPTPTTDVTEPTVYTYDCFNGNCIEVEGYGGTYSNLAACQDDCDPLVCFIEGTNITLSDGSQVLIETLQVGDVLMSFNIEGLPSDSDTNEVLTTWNTNEIVGNLSQTTIVNIVAKPSDKTILINNLLRTTEYHRHLVKHPTGWRFIQAKDVLVGQFLLDINNNEIEVTSVDVIEETVTIYQMDVEDIDLFYAEGILTHNIKQPEQTYCCSNGQCISCVDGIYATIQECMDYCTYNSPS
jgi:hypothetical protein